MVQRAVAWVLSGTSISTDVKATLARSIASVLRVPQTHRPLTFLVLLWNTSVQNCFDLALNDDVCGWLPLMSMAPSCSVDHASISQHLRPGKVHLIDAVQAISPEEKNRLLNLSKVLPSAGRPDLAREAMGTNLRYAVDKIGLRLGVQQLLYLDADTCLVNGNLDVLFSSNQSAPLVVANRESAGLLASWNTWNQACARSRCRNGTSPGLERLLADWGFSRMEHQFNNGMMMINTLAYCKSDFLGRLHALSVYMAETGALAGVRLNGYHQPYTEIAAAAVAHRVDKRWNCRLHDWRVPSLVDAAFLRQPLPPSHCSIVHHRDFCRWLFPPLDHRARENVYGIA